MNIPGQQKKNKTIRGLDGRERPRNVTLSPLLQWIDHQNSLYQPEKKTKKNFRFSAFQNIKNFNNRVDTFEATALANLVAKTDHISGLRY